MSDGFIIKKGGSGGDKYYSDFKAFVDRSITNVTAEMLQGVTNIGDYAFQYCQSLTSVTIPNSVTSIGEHAFQYCRSLASVTVKAITPPALGGSVFNNTHSSLVIYVPAESVEAYKAATNWSTYADKIQAIPSE